MARCTTTSSRAMQRVPEIAGRDLTLTALTGGITNRNFRVDAAGTDQRWVIRLAGNDTHLLGISPRGRARRDGRGGRRRRRSGGDRVHPARGLPRHPVHRRLAGLGRGRPPARDAPARRRLAAPDPRRSGDPGPVRAAPDRRGVPGAGDGPRRPDPARVRARGRRRAADRGAPSWPTRSSCGRATTTCSTPTSSTTATRIRIIDWEYAGMGDPFFDLGNFSINHELTADEDEILLAAYDGDVPPATPRPADADAGGLRLPRGDVGRPPAGRQHARRRLRGVCRPGTSTGCCGTPPPSVSNGPSRPSPRRRGRLSPMSDAPRPAGPRSIARSVGLGAVAFSATLILLFGMVEHQSAGRRERRAPRPGDRHATDGGAPSQAIATSWPSPGSLGIGRPGPRRGRRHRRLRPRSGPATAALLDTIDGHRLHRRRQRLRRTVAPPNSATATRRPGAAILDRTRPPPGTMNGTRRTSPAIVGYFGAAAGPDGASWYSYDLGAWHVIVLDSDCVFVGGCCASPARVAGWRRTSTARMRCARWRSGITRGSAPASTATSLVSAVLGCALRGRARTSSSMATTTTTSGSAAGSGRPRGQGGAASASSSSGPAAAVLRDFPTVAAHSEVRIASTFGVDPVRPPPDVVRVVVHRDVRRGRGLGERRLPLRYRGRP